MEADVIRALAAVQQENRKSGIGCNTGEILAFFHDDGTRIMVNSQGEEFSGVA
jgi:hypothetical protein